MSADKSIVIVVDNSNYKASYAEETPFKATIEKKDNEMTWVRSEVTGKIYELYFHQVLEYLDIEQISGLLDMTKYGRL